MKSHVEIWSAPGSLLLAGEYRITEEGGLGFSVATGGRAVLSSEPSEKLIVRGIYPGTEESWSEEKRNDGSLAGAVYKGIPPNQATELCRDIKMTLDTRSFFRASGSKLGFGSSAAGTLLLCGSMISRTSSIDISQRAVEAHRDFQNGRGSGYDVLTSYHGGCGIFKGGRRPSWTGLDWPWNLQAWVVKAPKPVKTVQAVAAYEKWKQDCERDWRDFAEYSDTVVENLAAAVRNAATRDNTETPEISDLQGRELKSPASFLRILSDAAERGAVLGRSIGISADPVLPSELRNLGEIRRDGVAVKCLGAGNELTLIAGLPGSFSSSEIQNLEMAVVEGSAEVLHIDPAGLQKEPEG